MACSEDCGEHSVVLEHKANSNELECYCSSIRLNQTAVRVKGEQRMYQFDLEACYEDSNNNEICNRDESRRDLVNHEISNTLIELNETVREITLEPNAGHNVEQVQKVYQEKTLGYFAIEPNILEGKILGDGNIVLEEGSTEKYHQPLKDTSARHILYNKRLHSYDALYYIIKNKY